MLVCIVVGIKHFHITSYTCIFCEDIDECTMNPGICGLGTCSVTDDGLYECTCQDGAMTTGVNTDNTLTCVGMFLV